MNNSYSHTGCRRSQSGLSYVEVLLATVLLVVALVPALEALRGGIQGAEIHQSTAADHYNLLAKLEDVLAESYAALEAQAEPAPDVNPPAPTSFSDSPGSVKRRVVLLAAYDGDDADADGDPFTGVDDDLLWVRVEIENTNHAIAVLTGK